MTDGKKLITQVASHDNNLTKTDKNPQNINFLYLTFNFRWSKLAAHLSWFGRFFFFHLFFDVKYCTTEVELKQIN